MSGLYNMIMSVNPASPYVLALIGVDEDKFNRLGRFRDCWVTPDASSVMILHRNYSDNGNDDVLEDVASWDNYVANHEAEGDSTYWKFEFKVPDDMSEAAKKIAEVTDTSDRWDAYRKVIDDLGKGKETEHTKRAMEAGKKIFDQIDSGESGTVQHEDGSVNVTNIQPEDPS